VFYHGFRACKTFSRLLHSKLKTDHSQPEILTILTIAKLMAHCQMLYKLKWWQFHRKSVGLSVACWSLFSKVCYWKWSMHMYCEIKQLQP
jgi:hypothetical protein